MFAGRIGHSSNQYLLELLLVLTILAKYQVNLLYEHDSVVFIIDE